jgi:hypothetical protein
MHPKIFLSVEVKSMLHEFEVALLHSLARNHWTGAGDILDLGPVNGLSTHALSSGMRTAKVGTNNRKIYSYDIWLRQDYEYFTDSPSSKKTGSVFAEWLRLNIDNLDLIVPWPGDLLWSDWSGDPIEILFV